MDGIKDQEYFVGNIEFYQDLCVVYEPSRPKKQNEILENCHKDLCCDACRFPLSAI